MKPVDKGLGLTVERLREALDYNPSTGEFTWKTGERAGSLENMGYWRIWIGQNRYLAHRLAWLFMTGTWPSEQIDHIDGNRANNRWSNLRPASHSQNKANGRLYRKKLALPKGVTFISGMGGRRFGAQIRFNNRTSYLGSFDTPEEAHAAYLAAARQRHGEFANAGRD